MNSFKEVIEAYQNYAQRKAEEERNLQIAIEKYKEKFSGEGAKDHTDSMRASLNSKYKAEFTTLGEQLNKLLDYQRDTITAPYNQRSTDYELKLNNTLNMLNMLNAKDIQENMAELKKAVRPFSNDNLAKKAIQFVLSKNNSPMSLMGLFDNQEQVLLEKIETARNFTSDKAYENQLIADDMERFFENYFPDIQEEHRSQSFDFNFQPATSCKESFWQQ